MPAWVTLDTVSLPDSPDTSVPSPYWPSSPVAVSAPSGCFALLPESYSEPPAHPAEQQTQPHIMSKTHRR